MKKIFLSLGFSGRKEKDIIEDIDYAKALLIAHYENDELEFVHNYYYNGNNKVECLGEAIKKLSTCDLVCFINNWRDHKGCLIEKEVCKLYEISYTSLIF